MNSIEVLEKYSLKEKFLLSIFKEKKFIIFSIIAIVLFITNIFVARMILPDLRIKSFIKSNNFSNAKQVLIKLKGEDNISSYKAYIDSLVTKYSQEEKYINIINLLNDFEKQYGKSASDYNSKNIEAKYKYVLQQYDMGNYVEADMYMAECLASNTYKSNEKLNKINGDIKCKAAKEYMDKEQYKEALKILITLDGTQPEAMELLQECGYQLGKKSIEEKSYDEAIGTLEAIQEYKDSKDLLSEAKYQKAVKCVTEDSEASLGEAVKLFESIGEYKDAKEQYISSNNELQYRIAERQFKEYKDKNNYSRITLRSIRDAFSNLGDYKESTNRVSEINEALVWHGIWYPTKSIDSKYKSSSLEYKVNYFKKTAGANNFKCTFEGNVLKTYYAKTETYESVCDTYTRSGNTMGHLTLLEE